MPWANACFPSLQSQAHYKGLEGIDWSPLLKEGTRQSAPIGFLVIPEPEAQGRFPNLATMPATSTLDLAISTVTQGHLKLPSKRRSSDHEVLILVLWSHQHLVGIVTQDCAIIYPSPRDRNTGLQYRFEAGVSTPS